MGHPWCDLKTLGMQICLPISLPEQVMGGEEGVLALLDSPVAFWGTVHTEEEGLHNPHTSPSNSSLLREDSQAEVSLLVWLKGARDEDVVSRGQLEAP